MARTSAWTLEENRILFTSTSLQSFFVVRNVFHGEATIGHHLLERNPLGMLLKPFARGGDLPPVLVGQGLVILWRVGNRPGDRIENRFQKPGDRRQLLGPQTGDQFVYLLPILAHRGFSL